jgi:hypothetical protein
LKLIEPRKLFINSQKIALLDLLLSPEWEYRYYSFNNNWAENQKMASMRNGSGLEYFILFENNNCGIKLYDSSINKDCKEYIFKNRNSNNIFIKNILNEPAFSIEDSTYLAFWNSKNNSWDEIGNCNNNLLNVVLNPIDEYIKYANDYYEKKLDKDIIEKIIIQNKIEKNILLNLNNKFNDYMLELNEIGLVII